MASKHAYVEAPPADLDNLDTFLEASETFGTTNRYPVDSNLTKTLLHLNLADRDRLLSNANESYPLIHEDLVKLFEDFLALKKAKGTEIEKGIYQGMGVQGLVDR